MSNRYELGRAYRGLGNIYKHEEDYTEAIQAYTHSLESFGSEFYFDVHDLLMEIANLHKKNNFPEKAKSVVRKAEELAQREKRWDKEREAREFLCKL